MTVLEATVEIVKASMIGEHSLVDYISNDTDREEFLKGVEAIYDKLARLENRRYPSD